MDIEEIISALRGSRVRITDHVDEGTANDGLSLDEVFFSVMRGEVIEDKLFSHEPAGLNAT
jgi:hypothetical protein